MWYEPGKRIQFPPITSIFQCTHSSAYLNSHFLTQVPPMYLKLQRGWPTELLQMQGGKKKKQNQWFAKCSRRVAFCSQAEPRPFSSHTNTNSSNRVRSGPSSPLCHNFTTPTRTHASFLTATSVQRSICKPKPLHPDLHSAATTPAAECVANCQVIFR